MEKLLKHAKANSTYYITITAQAYNSDDILVDIHKSDISSIKWTLTRNSDGHIINWREDVAVSTENPITIKLSGDDLPYLAVFDYLILTVDYIYTDADGDTAYLKNGYIIYTDKTEPTDIISCSGGPSATPSPSGTCVYTEAEKLAIEMDSEFKALKPTYYKDMNYTGGLLSNISIYETDQKVSKIWNKDLIYNGSGDLTSINLTRMSDNAKLIKTIDYTDGDVSSISVSAQG